MNITVIEWTAFLRPIRFGTLNTDIHDLGACHIFALHMKPTTKQLWYDLVATDLSRARQTNKVNKNANVNECDR